MMTDRYCIYIQYRNRVSLQGHGAEILPPICCGRPKFSISTLANALRPHVALSALLLPTRIPP
jgi:hypothetical protein